MLVSLAYLLIFGLLFGYIATKLSLPPLLGMLLSGILLGPYCFDLLDLSLLDISTQLRQIALVIILMRAGLALKLGELKSVGRPAILMSFAPACFEICAVVIFAPIFLDVTYLEAAIMGSVLAAVSPAVIVPKMLNLMERKIGTSQGIPQLIMAGSSMDDIFVIILFSSFLSLSMGGHITLFSILDIFISIVNGVILGVATGWLFSRYFKRFHMRDTIKVSLLISVSFLFLGLESSLKDYNIALSALLAVMVMGITILQLYPFVASRISVKLNKLWVVAEIVLFVLVGATVDISYITKEGFAAVAVIFIALLFRMFGVFVSTSKCSLTPKEQLFCMIAYIPKATVQAAIGALPLSMGLECGDIVLTLAVLAIIISAPLGAFGIDKTYKKLLVDQSK